MRKTKIIAPKYTLEETLNNLTHDLLTETSAKKKKADIITAISEARLRAIDGECKLIITRADVRSTNAQTEAYKTYKKGK